MITQCNSVIIRIAGVILPIVSAVLKSEWETSAYVAIPFFIIMIVGRLSPIFAFALGLARLTLQARLNAYCNLNKRKCPNLLVLDEPNFDSDFCCGKLFLIYLKTGLCMYVCAQLSRV